MNYRDFKAAVALDANEPKDYEQIVFRTPDGKNYHNVTIDFGYWNNSKDKAIIVNLFNIKPKFKVGDVVTNNGGLHSNVKCTIAVVNKELEYYGYKEVNGRTYFKDQDELKLVESVNSRPPVEGCTKSDSTVKIHSSIITADELRDNKDIYDTYTLIVQEIMSAIKRDAKQGKNKACFIIGERDINVFQLGQDFYNAGYKVSAVIGNDKNSEINIEW